MISDNIATGQQMAGEIRDTGKRSLRQHVNANPVSTIGSALFVIGLFGLIIGKAVFGK